MEARRKFHMWCLVCERQKQVSMSWIISYIVHHSVRLIACPCPRYLLLVHIYFVWTRLLLNNHIEISVEQNGGLQQILKNSSEIGIKFNLYPHYYSRAIAWWPWAGVSCHAMCWLLLWIVLRSRHPNSPCCTSSASLPPFIRQINSSISRRTVRTHTI